jgi:hypothetical protein
VNAAGTGPASAPSPAITPVAPTTVPGAPTSVIAKASNASVVLSWKPPVSNGGSAITGYRVTASIGSTTKSTAFVPASATSATIGALTNGTTYTFAVAAINAVGTGPATTATAVPSGPPSIRLTPLPPSSAPFTSRSNVTYSWVGTSNGSPIVHYNVFVKRANTGGPFPATWSSLGSTTQSSIVVSLARGQSQIVAVQAVDAVSNVSLLSAYAETTFPRNGGGLRGNPRRPFNAPQLRRLR